MSDRVTVIRRCPFCAGHGLMDTVQQGDETKYFLRCHSCACEGPWGKSSTSAVRWWNMRMAEQPDHLQAADGWVIGLSEDLVRGLGLYAKRAADQRGKDAIRIYWLPKGDGHEIAARLRELANALDDATADKEDHTFEGSG